MDKVVEASGVGPMWVASAPVPHAPPLSWLRPHAEEEAIALEPNETSTLSPSVDSPSAESGDCAASHGMFPAVPGSLLGDPESQSQEPRYRCALDGSARGTGDDLWRSMLVSRPATSASTSPD